MTGRDHSAKLAAAHQAGRARSTDPALREHFVYRCFDAEGQLLYVGCSRRVEARMLEHKYAARWYGQMARVTLAGPYTYAAARRIEAEVTRDEDPPHNGFAPTTAAARRERSRFASEVYRTALAHGQPWADAARQTVIAVDAEFGAPA